MSLIHTHIPGLVMIVVVQHDPVHREQGYPVNWLLLQLYLCAWLGKGETRLHHIDSFHAIFLSKREGIAQQNSIIVTRLGRVRWSQGGKRFAPAAKRARAVLRGA